MEHAFSLLKEAERTLIYIRQYSNRNGTFDISALDNNDDGKLFLYIEH